MNHLTDKVAYIRGLMEGLKLDTQTNEGKILSQIVELLGEMAGELEDVQIVQEEMSSFVDSIDEDLCELEHVIGLDDEEDDEDEDEEDDEDFSDDDFDDEECTGDCEECGGCGMDEDDENVYVECMCPNCQSAFYVLEHELGDGVFHVCPRCGEKIHVEPDYDEEIPVAKLADKDPDEE